MIGIQSFSYSVPSSTLKSTMALRWTEGLAIIVAVIAAATADLSMSGSLPVIATALFLFGGLPHGAFDIHRVILRASMGFRQLIGFLTVYIGIFLTTLLAWKIAPSLVLPLFIVASAIHFGEDWPEINEPLFRLSLGFAPICAIAVAHPTDVTTIFATMAGEVMSAALLDTFVLVAPVTLLVALVALVTSIRSGSWQRPALFASLIASLFVLPAMIGFVLFFCAFHTPRHLVSIRNELAHRKPFEMAATGAIITILALAIGLTAIPSVLSGGALTAAAGFQLLAALAMPHQFAAPVARAMQRWLIKPREQRLSTA